MHISSSSVGIKYPEGGVSDGLGYKIAFQNGATTKVNESAEALRSLYVSFRDYHV